MQTVTVTINTLFQNATPFEGFVRVKLGTPLVEVDSTFIAQLNPQEIDFGGGNPEVSFIAIPNSVLGEDTYYVVEIYRDTLVGAHHEYDCIYTGNIVIPDHDCNLADIAVIEPIAPEPVEVSKKFASEAKQYRDEAQKAQEGAKKAAAAAEYFADNADEIITNIEELTKYIVAVGGVTVGQSNEIVASLIKLAKTEPIYWTILNTMEYQYSGIISYQDTVDINAALPTPVDPMNEYNFVMTALKNAATLIPAEQVVTLTATWYDRGLLTEEDLVQIMNILEAVSPTA